MPDADFFEAIRSGSVSVVTDSIRSFTPEGITLESGDTVGADVIITATGLSVQMFGGADIEVDGRPIASGELVAYKGTMYANVPNMSVTFGYTNASWTLKADLTSEYTCRVLNHMREVGATTVAPRLDSGAVDIEEHSEFTPGYFQRAASIMPKRGKRKPWRLDENYLLDVRTLRHRPIDDGVLRFS